MYCQIKMISNYDGKFDQEEINKCVEDIYEVFKFDQERPKLKSYVSFAFLNLRISDDPKLDTFHNDEKVFKYAKQYYIAIRKGKYISLGSLSMDLDTFCRTTRTPLAFQYDLNHGRSLTRYEGCMYEMAFTPLLDKSHVYFYELFDMKYKDLEIIYWIYDNIVIDELDKNASRYLKEYVEKSARHFEVDSCLTPIEFCCRLQMKNSEGSSSAKTSLNVK